jgi:hypothetical protein
VDRSGAAGDEVVVPQLHNPVMLAKAKDGLDATHQERQTMTKIEDIRHELRTLLEHLAAMTDLMSVEQIHAAAAALREPVRGLRP